MTFKMNHSPLFLFCTTLLTLTHSVTPLGPCPTENRGVCISEIQLSNHPTGHIGACVELYLPSGNDVRDLFLSFYTLARETVTIPVHRSGSSRFILINVTLHLPEEEATAVILTTEQLDVLDGVLITRMASAGASELGNRFGVSTVEVDIGSVSVSRCGQTFQETDPTLGRGNLCTSFSGEPDFSQDEEDPGDSLVTSTIHLSKVMTTKKVTKQPTAKARQLKTSHHYLGNTSRRPTSTTKKAAKTSHISTTPPTVTKPRTAEPLSTKPTGAISTRTIKSTSGKGTTPTSVSTSTPTSSKQSTTKVHTTPTRPLVTRHRTSTLLPSSISSSKTNKPASAITQSTKIRTQTPKTTGSGKSPRTSKITPISQAATTSSVKLSSTITSQRISTRTSVKPIASTNPSAESTASPGAESTKSPSAESTTSPSAESTTSPSAESTTSPSAESTKSPSAESTKSPSAESTTSPSAESTTSPSAESTKSPSAESTKSPSAESTTSPSAESTTSPRGGRSSDHSSPQRSASTSSVSTASTRVPYTLELYISEVNVLIDRDINTTFIELQGPHHMSLVHYSMVVFDGKTKATLYHRRFTDTDTFTGSGFYLVEGLQITGNPASILIGLYDNRKWLQPYENHVPVSQAKGLLDSFAIRTTTDSLNADIMESLLPTHENRVFSIKPSLTEKTGMTVSRCTNTPNDPGAFILSFSSPGAANNCTLGSGHRIQFKLTNADCKDFRNTKLQVQLVDFLVSSVNHLCMCGFTHELITERNYTCGSLIFEADIRASTDWQVNAIFSKYHDYVTTTVNDVVIGGQRYTVDTSCVQDCYPPPVNPDNNSPGDTTLTVAIVVSCVGVFMVVVIGVIIYIHRKKRSIVTFRLTNLGEMDTSNMLHEDRDDFVEEDQSTFRSIALVTT